MNFLMPPLSPSLTLTDVPLQVEMVAGVTVTDAAVRAALTVSVTADVSA